MQGMTPTQLWQKGKERIKPEWKLAFMAAVLIGLMVHLPMMLSDIPNHDGLDSMYFDQNMITSGRWFLTVACGFSSYYALPWLISIFSILILGVTAAVLVETLQLKDRIRIVLVSGLLAVFPAIASTFAYVFTMDGYMLALLLAVSAVCFTGKSKWGFVPGAVCLAFSLGTYQAYLPFTVLLSLYGCVMLAIKKLPLKEKWWRGLRYLYMGVLGLALYYGILQVLLKIQGKELASYQGINGMEGGDSSLISRLPSIVARMYRDFGAFTLKGNVFTNNGFSKAACLVLLLAAAAVLVGTAIKRGWWKSPWFYGIILFTAAVLPPCTNLILVISPDVTYHLLMRYQWVLFLILPLAFTEQLLKEDSFTKMCAEKKDCNSGDLEEKCANLCTWAVTLAAAVLLFNYGVTDNIAYSNLEKKYEKTYAYCIRLLDRIEQTPGYYQGIPIAMIGVVGEESYPQTDITQSVTEGMIGMSGDWLLYRADNYKLFMEYYLGATLNMLPQEAMADIYNSTEYREMDSFPGADSIRIVDGVMYIKTENKE